MYDADFYLNSMYPYRDYERSTSTSDSFKMIFSLNSYPFYVIILEVPGNSHGRASRVTKDETQICDNASSNMSGEAV